MPDPNLWGKIRAAVEECPPPETIAQVTTSMQGDIQVIRAPTHTYITNWSAHALRVSTIEYEFVVPAQSQTVIQYPLGAITYVRV